MFFAREPPQERHKREACVDRKHDADVIKSDKGITCEHCKKRENNTHALRQVKPAPERERAHGGEIRRVRSEAEECAHKREDDGEKEYEPHAMFRRAWF